jgi:hypothetical protein
MVPYGRDCKLCAHEDHQNHEHRFIIFVTVIGEPKAPQGESHEYEPSEEIDKPQAKHGGIIPRPPPPSMKNGNGIL